MILFPVLIGPTFTPVWEAFKMKKPVIFSNLDGVKNVYRDGVSYVDPLNKNEIATAISELFINNEFRENLIKKGSKVLEDMEIKDEYSQVFKIIKRYRNLKKTWKPI